MPLEPFTEIPLKQWSKLPRLAGIYRITHKRSKRYYIGSAQDIHHRIGVHRREMEAGKHHSRIIQRTYDKYGLSCFTVCILEFVTDHSRLLVVEQEYIDASKPALNCAPLSNSCKGVVHTPETRIKRRAATIRNWNNKTPEQKKEWAARSSQRMKDWWARATPEQREAKSDAARAKEVSRIESMGATEKAAWRASLSERGRSGVISLRRWHQSLSEEHKQKALKITKAAQEQWRRDHPEEHRDAIARMKATKATKTPEQRAERLRLFRISMAKKRATGWNRKWK